LVDGELISNGGRVLSCTAIGGSLQEAAERAYSLIESLELEGSHYRKDIGYRAL
jgi:phosphoribosylamine--glycine ligase